MKFRDRDVAVAGLLQIAHDLASKRIKTGQIYDLDQRNEYAEALSIAPISHKSSGKMILPPAIPATSGDGARAIARMRRGSEIT